MTNRAALEANGYVEDIWLADYGTDRSGVAKITQPEIYPDTEFMVWLNPMDRPFRGNHADDAEFLAPDLQTVTVMHTTRPRVTVGASKAYGAAGEGADIIYVKGESYPN